MTDAVSYPWGEPCWVDSLQPDPEAAVAFYSSLFGWEFDDPTAHGYRVARLGGRRVAGVGQAPPMLDRGAWATYFLVDDLDRTVGLVDEAGGTLLVGPAEGSDGERTALFDDPSGAPFGVRGGSTPLSAEILDAPGAWQMSALHTPDLAAAGKFYAAVFGWRLEMAPGSGVGLWRLAGSTRRAAHPTMPDDVIAVATGAEPGFGVPPHWAVNVQVADTDAVARRVVELGGSLLMPPTDAPGFRNAVLADPSGGVLAISQFVEA
ncbi:putative enzyme related to lactoylglutathione lyase [Paenarthrobacter nitroguajacolicus]|uniref:VOC family protein n=1 Tax=Paenarthrobacter nitroguajacolicus TaxID=211146 RepID=UPI0028594DC5|nr:VOC family protein [Paenarthrobacter nitroguajacolicus]MDR6988409.1 putative enzyme related to lactoylglutathione lyase [Paenarthrobacter nitroguajacolicus]